MKVRELLTDESKWTQGVIARDERGVGVTHNSPLAVSWCLIGALGKCYKNDFLKILCKISERLKGDDVSLWNDSHSFADVKALIEELDI